MPGTYVDAIALSESVEFQSKVRVSVLQAAVDVLNEAATIPDHDRRAAYAVAVLRNSAAEVPRIAEIVAAVNPTIRATAPAVPSDSDVQFVVNQLFSIFART